MLYSYHPMMDMSKINEYMGKINSNATQFGTDFAKNKEEYLEYTTRVYETTQENTTILMEHVNETKEASDQAVTDGLANAKEIKIGTSIQNQNAMSDFSGKLPYTRLGTMEYTQAYEFIANPVQYTEVSDYEQIKQDSGKSTQNANEKAEDLKQSILLKRIACVMGVAVIVGIPGGYIHYKKKTKVKLKYIGN